MQLYIGIHEQYEFLQGFDFYTIPRFFCVANLINCYTLFHFIIVLVFRKLQFMSLLS